MPTLSGEQAAAVRISRFLEPIFPRFLDIQRDYLDQLDTALGAGDVSTLHRLGHSMKGGAATYQLPLAADLAARLEAAALCRDLETANCLVGLLRHYYASLVVCFVDKDIEPSTGTD